MCTDVKYKDAVKREGVDSRLGVQDDKIKEGYRRPPIVPRASTSPTKLFALVIGGAIRISQPTLVV